VTSRPISQEIDGIVDRIEEFVEPCLLAHDNPGHVAPHGDAEQEDLRAE
jgi:hypothetical protein